MKSEKERNQIETFSNPLIGLKTENIWQNYGVGDPFVLRYNGRYYLYCSTKDGEVGIQCWISENLTDWHYFGLCATEKLTESAYAPEVVYYNGAFYMYTSPAGRGHYVLKSDSPTGPFTAVTGNFGHTIDGSVFIDDDGKWYFYCAGFGGIDGYPMSAPDRVSDETIDTGCFMRGWTEGPAVIRYDGNYYMTYTGNHVWSDGYRIDYGVSKTVPTEFTAGGNNPVLVSSSGNITGTGHSSTVLSPRLDSYYIVYHSAIGAPRRQMNTERLVLNGTRLDALGPNDGEQQAPGLPDVYGYMEEEDDLKGWQTENAGIRDGRLHLYESGFAVSEYGFTGDFSAEFNMRSVSESAGAVFAYTDEKNYASAFLNREKSTLDITITRDGVPETVPAKLIRSFGEEVNLSVNQLITVCRRGNAFTFFVNNLLTFTLESDIPSGKIGVRAEKGEADCGFIGASCDSYQSSLKKIFKPVPGILPAITCAENTETEEIGGTSFVKISAGQKLNYRVLVREASSYDLAVTYRASSPCSFGLYQDGKLFISDELSPSEGGNRVRVFRNISFSGGASELTLEITKGEALLFSFELKKYTEVIPAEYNCAEAGNAAYSDGEWERKDGRITLIGETGKILYGDEAFGDYTAEADIILRSKNINFGMLVRASNPASGGSGGDAVAGTDFVQGYYIGLSLSGVLLAKQNYSFTELKSAEAIVRQKLVHHLRVSCIGNTLKIRLDGEELITYTDNDSPFLQGRAGFRGYRCVASAENFKTEPYNGEIKA